MSKGDQTLDRASGGRIGQVLGDTYRLLSLIGEGGMGEVYEAEHLRLKSRCAVKLLTAVATEQPDVIRRFKREAEIAAGLGSEQVVKVFDLNDTDDGIPYLVMEVLKGEDLASRLDTAGRMPPAQWAPMLAKVASALDLVHGAGVVHRDLKPANVFLHRNEHGEDVPKILDFGISKIRGNLTAVTQDIAFLGTPQYMSPEQAGGAAATVDHRSDIFSLGTITYEVLTGTRPFVAPTPVGIMYQICHKEPVPLREHDPDLPQDLEKVVLRALARDPDDRYQTASELAQAFRQALDTKNTSIGTPAPVPADPVPSQPTAGGIGPSPSVSSTSRANAETAQATAAAQEAEAAYTATAAQNAEAALRPDAPGDSKHPAEANRAAKHAETAKTETAAGGTHAAAAESEFAPAAEPEPEASPASRSPVEVPSAASPQMKPIATPAKEPEPLSMARGTMEETPRRAGSAWLVAGIGLVLAIAALGYFILHDDEPASRGDSVNSASSPSLATPPPGKDTSTGPRDGSAETTEIIQVNLDGIPREAKLRVFVDHRLHRHRPLRLRAGQPVTLRFEATGFRVRPETMKLTPEADRTLTLALKRAEPRPGTRTGARPGARPRARPRPPTRRRRLPRRRWSPRRRRSPPGPRPAMRAEPRPMRTAPRPMRAEPRPMRAEPRPMRTAPRPARPADPRDRPARPPPRRTMEAFLPLMGT